MKFYVIQPNDKRYEYAARLLEQDGHQLTPEPEQAQRLSSTISPPGCRKMV